MSDIIVDYNPFYLPICNNCKNWLGELECKAFTEIPKPILLGKNNHSKPYPGQKGDFVFTPKE